jgi:hypothetical protein
MSIFVYLDGRLSGHPDTTTTREGFLVFHGHDDIKIGRDEEGLLVHRLLNEVAATAERIPSVLKPYVRQIRMYREIPNRNSLLPGCYHHGEAEAILENDDEDQEWLGVVIQGTDMVEVEGLFQMLLSGTIQPTPRREIRRRQTARKGSLFSIPPPPASIKSSPLDGLGDLSGRFLPPSRLNKPKDR